MSKGTPERTRNVTDNSSAVEKLLPHDVALPETLTEVINFDSWANALINGTKYREPDPEYLSRLLLTQTLTAATIDEVFEQGGIRKLQESVPNVPDASTGPIEIRGIYVARSDQEDGFSCYLILDIVDMETGMEAKYTTGAGQVQAQILRLISLGVWPIRCKISRTNRKDRGGRYLFWVFPADA